MARPVFYHTSLNWVLRRSLIGCLDQTPSTGQEMGNNRNRKSIVCVLGPVVVQEIYFKLLTHETVGTAKSEVYKIDLQAGNVGWH